MSTPGVLSPMEIALIRLLNHHGVGLPAIRLIILNLPMNLKERFFARAVKGLVKWGDDAALLIQAGFKVPVNTGKPHGEG